jgi:hypothetical protein
VNIMVAEVIPMPHASSTTRCATAPSAHRGPALLLAAALALATAVALLRAETLVADTWVDAEPATANEEVVRRYYAAANAAIVAGEIDGLMAVVAADLVLPPGLSEGAGVAGRDVLVDRFLALHEAQPNLRVVVRDIVADEDDVVARVAIEGVGSGLPPAVRFSRFDEDWLDGFHVQRGKVVAAWGATVGLRPPDPVLLAEISNPHLAEPVVGLTRLTLAPGAQMPVLIGPGPMVVMPEATTLRVRIDGVGRLTRAGVGGNPTLASTERGVSFELGPWDQVAVSAGVSFTLRNPGDEPAVALVAAVYPAIAFDPVTFDNAGIETRSLAVAIFEPDHRGLPNERADHLDDLSISWEPLSRGAAPVSPGRLRLSVERVVVAPGGVIPAFQPTSSMLVAVEQGMVVTDVDRGPGDEVRLPTILVEGDEAILLQQDAAATIRNVGDESAVVLGLTIAPPGAAAGVRRPAVVTPPVETSSSLS